MPRARQFHRCTKRSRRVQHFFLEGLVLVQVLMRRGIGLHVADIAVNFRNASRGDQFHVSEPVRQRPAPDLGSNAIAMDHDAETTALQMPGIGLAFQFECLGFPGGLAMG